MEQVQNPTENTVETNHSDTLKSKLKHHQEVLKSLIDEYDKNPNPVLEEAINQRIFTIEQLEKEIENFDDILQEIARYKNNPSREDPLNGLTLEELQAKYDRASDRNERLLIMEMMNNLRIRARQETTRAQVGNNTPNSAEGEIWQGNNGADNFEKRNANR